MAADTLITENLRPRKLAGVGFILLGLPITLIFVGFALTAIDGLLDAVLVATGPAMTLGGLWLATSRKAPKVILRITDTLLELPQQNQSIALSDILSVTERRPFGANQIKLIIKGTDATLTCDVTHLSHDVRDILSLISIRLEQQERYLTQGRTDVRGAPNGIWTVQEGLPFEQSANRARLPHGRE